MFQCVLKHQHLQLFFGTNLTNISNFHQLEIVERASKTQIKVGENLSKISYSGED